jgi:hypothetical protein
MFMPPADESSGERSQEGEEGEEEGEDDAVPLLEHSGSAVTGSTSRNSRSPPRSGAPDRASTATAARSTSIGEVAFNLEDPRDLAV